MRHLLSHILLTGCAHVSYMDPEFKPYVDSYDKWASAHCLPTKNIALIYFKPDLVYPNVGVCAIYVEGLRTIGIHKTWWDTSPEFSRRAVLVHELLHCHLEIDHLPWGIMAPSLGEYNHYLYNADIDLLLFQLEELNYIGCWPSTPTEDP